MRIAAIYIYENSLPYIFGENHKDCTINLGGEYLYDVGEIRGKTVILKKVRNNNFINDFWNNNVTLISAIVGANGTGKSKILEYVKTGCELVIENGKASKIVWSNNVGQFLFHTPYLTENNEGQDQSNVFNLSKLSQITKDSGFANMDFNGHWEYHTSERLKRILISLENEDFKKSFNDLKISTFDKVKIKFLRIKEDDWNTSRNFIPYFTALIKLKEKEWTETEIELQKKFKIKNNEDLEKNISYKIASQKLRLRLSILETIILKIHSILERTGNKFLEEGFINGNNFPTDPEFNKIESTKEAFFWFINNAYFKLTSKKYFLPVKDIENLVNTILPFVDLDSKIDNWTILTVNFDNAKKIIESYQAFLISFKDIFTYDEKIFITFYPDKNLSTGEMSFYELFSSLNNANYRIKNKLDLQTYDKVIDHKNYTFLLDESDLGFHPYWKKKYIKFLCDIIPKIFNNKNIQIIITTHDPLTLSDIPNNNIVYLRKQNYKSEVLNFDSNERPNKTFGANITDLLSDSFFIEDGLIGEFAKDKIEKTINWINTEKIKKEKSQNNYAIDEKEYRHHKKIISIIDEHVIRLKLAEMLEELKGEKKLQEELIDKEIEYLLNKKRML
jgi:predicted ATPase